MFVSDGAMKIKLIDFGMAFPISKLPQGCKLQNVGYRWITCCHCSMIVLSLPSDMFYSSALRAPEVDLGLPITQAIDVWSVGCVLFFIFTGTHIFHLKCRYQKVGQRHQTVGAFTYSLFWTCVCSIYRWSIWSSFWVNQRTACSNLASTPTSFSLRWTKRMVKNGGWTLVISGFSFTFVLALQKLRSNLCAEDIFASNVSTNSVFQTPDEYEIFSLATTMNDVSQRIASLDELTEVSSLSVDQITARLLSLWTSSISTSRCLRKSHNLNMKTSRYLNSSLNGCCVLTGVKE